MSKRNRVSAYTPSNMDPELLKRIFVQREKLLDSIVNKLSTSMTTGDKHHILLVGPRGSGKTHLVSLAAWELTQKPELLDTMRIAWLGEDDIFSGLIHFAFAVAKSLFNEYPDEFPSDFKSNVRGLPADDAALSVLNEVLKNLQHRHLLVITENLDQTFSGLGEMGQKKLRAFLQETRRIATLTTSQQLFDGVSSRKEAFYGFFDIHHLEPLTVEDAQQLIRNIAVEQQKSDLIQYLNSSDARYRIRALHHLAGGNYRMYVLLAEFLTKDDLDDLVAAFETLAEEMTPYFQERMRWLPDQQRQLVQCLCDAEGALTVKEIAEETFIAEGNCSKQLGNLKTKGYVRSEKRGKESYYDMAEPLMRLCLEVKNQRGRPLQLVTRFLKAWFPEDKLRASINLVGYHSRAVEYCKIALQCDDTFKTIINSKLTGEIIEKLQAGDFQQMLALADELTVSERNEGLYYRAWASGKLYDRRSEVAALTGILDSTDARVEQKASALFNRGVTYGLLGNAQAELADYTALIKMPEAPNEQKANALINRGFTYWQLGDAQAALTDYTAMIEMPDARCEQKAKTLINRGVIYEQLGDAQAALIDYTAVSDMSDAPCEQKVAALINRGLAFGRLDKAQAALADYTAVIEIPDASSEQKANARINRGLTYWQQEDAQAALADCTVVIDMPDVPDEQKAKALFNRGVMHWANRAWQASVDDFEESLRVPNASSNSQTIAMFAVFEPMVAISPLPQVVAALARAFEKGNKQSDYYGGTPHDLLSMIVDRGPSEWADYISAIAPLYIKHGVAERLGQGVTHSIQFLDERDFSSSQLEVWNQAWQNVGKECDALKIPLTCLDAAVEILKSDVPSDRPLFRLPLEVRELIRPLLQRTLSQN
ncbi:MAG: winged helix-turn-helix transcriptional regulator [Gammaproteobacteria bacterium]|nr:winged helix-turn-helix transcriptional regulator [Gammaproteobacteria bacterium]